MQSIDAIYTGRSTQFLVSALPEIVAVHPEAVYMILGETHPHIKRDQGESYRLALQRRARKLGVEDHLVFHNRFVDLQTLCEFLGATDVYVTPYLNREQIVSGTLAYALGTGKAVVSTAYWHAEELLAEGRGRLVPFEDAAALAKAVNELLSRDVERHAMRIKAYTHCRGTVWKEVARRYLETFDEVLRERQSLPHTAFQAKTVETATQELPRLKLDHLIRLTDDVGIMQHAIGIAPNRFHGYCTDDNARALIGVLLAQSILPETERLLNLSCTYLSFLHYAFNDQKGRFRNLMNYDRTWSEEQGSADCHGRAVWALGSAIALSRSSAIRVAALQLFDKALPALPDLEAPRAWAFALEGLHAYLSQYTGDSEARRLRETLANRLFDLCREDGHADWPWFEETLTYANAKVPQALIQSGNDLQNEEMLTRGLALLHWLLELQTDPQNHFVPVGSNGWYPRQGQKARFAQQPIEAMTMVEACQSAYAVTGDSGWLTASQDCLEWFLGRNDLNVPLYDYQTGGCCDGLEATGANQNQGAESTLAWLLALVRVHRANSNRTESLPKGDDKRDTPEARSVPTAARASDIGLNVG